MGEVLSQTQFEEALELAPDERFAYFLRESKESGIIWSLAQGDGLVILGTEEDASYVLLFSHAEFAEAWFTEENPLEEDADLVAMSRENWANGILPELAEEKLTMMVMPGQNDEGTIIDPLELAKLLHDDDKDAA